MRGRSTFRQTGVVRTRWIPTAAAQSLALAIALAVWLPASGAAQRRGTSPSPTRPGHRGTADTPVALGPRLPLAVVIARTLAHSPTVAGATGAVRDASAARRVALGAYLPSLALNSVAGWSNQTVVNINQSGPSTASPSTRRNGYGVGLAATLDLFTGGRRGAQRSQAAAISRAAGAGLVSQRYATVLTATQGYLDVLRAHELVRVSMDQVTQAELGLGYARDRHAAGTATRADVLSAQLALSTAARQQLAARDTLGATAAALGRLVGANGPVDAEPAATLEPTPLTLDDSAVLALAVGSAPSIQAARAQAGADVAAVRAAKTQYIPTIAAGASYNWATDSRIPGGLRPGWAVQLTTSFPLFDGFLREATITQAEAVANVSVVTEADTRRFVRAEAQRLLGSLHVAEQDIMLAREAVGLAVENLRVIRARYRAGIATILDELTAQTSLVQAQLDLVSARYDYQVTRASLGALLGRRL